MKNILLGIVTLFCVSCASEPAPSLSMADKSIADSLYKVRVVELKPEMDSLCKVSFDVRVQKAVDSILVERRAEIAKQMERIRNLELEN